MNARVVASFLHDIRTRITWKEFVKTIYSWKLIFWGIWESKKLSTSTRKNNTKTKYEVERGVTQELLNSMIVQETISK
jgi:hypothetical protein